MGRGAGRRIAQRLTVAAAVLVSAAACAETTRASSGPRVLQEHRVADWTLRVVEKETDLRDPFPRRLEIRRAGRLVHALEGEAFGVGADALAGSELAPTAGLDITGDGVANLVVSRWVGGNGCATSELHVFELGERFRVVAVLPWTETSTFRRVARGGPWRYHTHDDAWCYWGGASRLESPAPELVFRWAGGTYRLAPESMPAAPSPGRFAELAAAVRVVDGRPSAELWAPMITMAYAGRLDLARRFLAVAWPLEGGADGFWRGFVAHLEQSRWYRSLVALRNGPGTRGPAPGTRVE